MPPQRPRARARAHPLGEAAALAELGTRLDTALNTRAIALAAALKKRRDVRQAVAGHASVTVQFDPDQVTHEALAAAIRRLAARRPPMEEPGRLHRIPVVYDGPDLSALAPDPRPSTERGIPRPGKPTPPPVPVGFGPAWAYPR